MGRIYVGQIKSPRQDIIILSAVPKRIIVGLILLLFGEGVFAEGAFDNFQKLLVVRGVCLLQATVGFQL